MKDHKNSHHEIDQELTQLEGASVDATRRALIKRYGALAAVTPVALSLTMYSRKALASECTECEEGF